MTLVYIVGGAWPYSPIQIEISWRTVAKEVTW